MTCYSIDSSRFDFPREFPIFFTSKKESKVSKTIASSR